MWIRSTIDDSHRCLRSGTAKQSFGGNWPYFWTTVNSSIFNSYRISLFPTFLDHLVTVNLMQHWRQPPVPTFQNGDMIYKGGIRPNFELQSVHQILSYLIIAYLSGIVWTMCICSTVDNSYRCLCSVFPSCAVMFWRVKTWINLSGSILLNHFIHVS